MLTTHRLPGKLRSSSSLEISPAIAWIRAGGPLSDNNEAPHHAVIMKVSTIEPAPAGLSSLLDGCGI